MKNKQKYNYLFVLSSLFIFFSTVGFSFIIPCYDGKINDIELDINNLQFNIFQLHQAQTMGHVDFNLRKVLTEINPVSTEQKSQLLQDSIDATKAAIVSAHALKYGKIINNIDELKELYPETSYEKTMNELTVLLEEPAYFKDLGRDLRKQKDIKKIYFGLSVFFQIIGLLMLYYLTYYKEYKEKN